jgi:hypothetical protein
MHFFYPSTNAEVILPQDNSSRPLEPGGLYLNGPHQGSDLIRVEEMLKQKMLSR